MVIAGFLVTGLVILIGWLSGLLRDVPWPYWALILATVLTVISVADRDGWRIRRAMAYVAIQQRARWTRGPLPATPSLAQAWLDDPANADASALERTSALLTIGNLATARAILDTFEPTSDVQAAAAARTRSYLGALETGTMDMAPIRAASDGLGDDDRRYQLTAAAWTQAWLDIKAGRPWRQRFAHVVRDLGPHPLPVRVLVLISVPQLAAPIATVLATIIVAGVAGASA